MKTLRCIVALLAIPLLARAELRWDKKEVERHPTGNGTTSHPVPGLSLTVEQGGGCQCVRMVSRQYTHQGIYRESRRGGPNAPWEFLCIDTEGPYEDERPCSPPASLKCANTACAMGTKARPMATGAMW